MKIDSDLGNLNHPEPFSERESKQPDVEGEISQLFQTEENLDQSEIELAEINWQTPDEIIEEFNWLNKMGVEVHATVFQLINEALPLSINNENFLKIDPTSKELLIGFDLRSEIIFALLGTETEPPKDWVIEETLSQQLGVSANLIRASLINYPKRQEEIFSSNSSKSDEKILYFSPELAQQIIHDLS